MDPSSPSARIPLSRIIANVIATFGILLIVAVALYGVGRKITQDSYWEWYAEGRWGSRSFRVDGVGVQLELDPPVRPIVPTWPIPRERGLDFMGFTLLKNTPEWRNANTSSNNMLLGVPWWPIVVIYLARPVFRWLRRIDEAQVRSQARDLTICAVCGYDLRATPTRCPECGTERVG
jgi:hypothetical protein